MQMAWHATFQACAFFELSPRLFSATMTAANFILSLNENSDFDETLSLQKLLLPEKHKLCRCPTIKEIMKSKVLPSEFHIKGSISNESKPKWKEEILMTSVG